MTHLRPVDELSQFLISAKHATYAAGGDAPGATPVLSGTRQLEHRLGDLFYRDIYAGSLVFAGQEMVYFREGPLWSMSYAGGVLPGVDVVQARGIYALLREALNAPPPNRPFRGPPEFAGDRYRYTNEASGDLRRFHGREQILLGKEVVYQLHYGGGVLL